MPDHHPVAAAPETAALLRGEVGMLRRRESRRVFDMQLFVGTLGDAPRDSFVVRTQELPRFDHGLRVDVADTLLDAAAPTWTTAWLVRPGVPALHDEDLEWLAAVEAAFTGRDRVLGAFYAVTRYGWLDVRGGASRHWRRLRL
ncbi:MAG: hypothetical protein ACRDPI_07060 [Nocardioidaceae bacterium]